jgi:PhnB protein
MKLASGDFVMAKVDPIPPQYGSITPYLVIPNSSQAIEAYKQVFAAEELMRMPTPDGGVGHCELKIGDSILMLSDGGPQHPKTASLTCLYVEDCDAVFARAVAAGWQVIEPLEDKFYGDRSGSVTDPFGQRWSLMTHKEDLSPEEMQARMDKLMSS